MTEYLQDKIKLFEKLLNILNTEIIFKMKIYYYIKNNLNISAHVTI